MGHKTTSCLAWLLVHFFLKMCVVRATLAYAVRPDWQVCQEILCSLPRRVAWSRPNVSRWPFPRWLLPMLGGMPLHAFYRSLGLICYLLMIIHFQCLIPVWGCWNRSIISDITPISGSLATTGVSSMNPPEFWLFTKADDFIHFDVKFFRRSHTLLPHQEARIPEASKEMSSTLSSGRVHQI